MARIRSAALGTERATRSPASTSRARRSRRRRFLAVAEGLEERRLLTAYHWVGGSSGDFGVAANWADPNNHHAVPGASDDVTISGGATVTVTGTAAVNTITADGTETIDVSGGTLTVNNAHSASSTFGILDVSGGGDFVVAGGTTTVSGTGTSTIHGTIDGAGGLTVAGTLDWTGGTMQGSGTITIPKGATLDLETGFLNLDQRTIDNAGTTNLSGTGSVDLVGATFNNEAGGTFVAASGANIGFHQSGTFSNAGTLEINPGAGNTATIWALTFNNTGTVDVESGSLQIMNNGTDTGAIDVTSGAALIFNSTNSTQNYTIAPGATWQGGGSLALVGGFVDLLVDTDLTVPSLSISTGALDGTANVTVTGTLDWTGGAIQGTGTITIPAGATLDIDGTKGTENLVGRTIDNAGTARRSGNQTFFVNGPFVNEAGGTFVATAPSLLFGSGPSSAFTNAGTLEVDPGTGQTTTMQAGAFKNTGTVDIQSGSLQIVGGGTDSGALDVAAGASLVFSSTPSTGSYTIAAGATWQGSGGFHIAGDFVDLLVDTNLTVPSLSISTGALDGTADLTVTGALDWTGGAMQGTGTTTIPAGATLDINGTVSLVGRTIDNAGTTHWSGAGPVILNGGAAFSNESGGTFVATSGSTFGELGGGRFSNAGTIEINPGAGNTTTISANPFDNTGTIAAQSGTLVINDAALTSGTVLNVAPGTSVDIAGGSVSGATFDVGAGAVVDLTDGQTVTYSGTLNGSGAGTVQLASGEIDVGLGGLTLDFAGPVFQWTGGEINTAEGDLTNLGTMNLAGSNDKKLFNDGTLDDFGTIVQTGSGNIFMHGGGHAPTTVKIEPGASYLIESDSGVDNNHENAASVVNGGTIEKTAGTGTSTILDNGTLSNTGTIVAHSGTLALEPAVIAQVSGGALSGGTWEALDGATLQLPAGTAIMSSAGDIALSGVGATVNGIAGLASNSGGFTLSGGAVFTTAGGFTNSGDLTVGPGSRFSAAGPFTQTSAGSLGLQIGGTPASGQYGQVAVTGSAALGGDLSVSLVSGFNPSLGQVYPVLSYASATGRFAQVTGLPSGMTATQAATAIDLATAAAGADLAVTSVGAPTTAAVGQSIAVGWQVKDVDATAAAGSWQDSVYLSPTSFITGSSILLGTAVHAVGLGAGATYSGSLTAPLPALTPGSYYVLVQADSLDQLPDPNRVNNTLPATGQLAVSLPSLMIDKAVTGSFTAAEQEDYYQVTVPAGGSLVVSAISAAPSGSLAVYISQGTLPTPYDYQDASAVPDQPAQTAVVPQVLIAGTYDILVEGVSGAAATAGYTLTVTQGNAPTISGLSTTSGGNAGNITVEIDGTNLAPTDTASLTLGSSTVAASSIDYVGASQIFATFPLAGATVGNYLLRVQQGSQSVTAPTPLQVVPATAGTLSVNLSVPQFIRPDRAGTIVLSYTNETSNDIIAPLLAVSSTNPNILFSTPDDPNHLMQSVQVLAVAPSGPAGILMPGESGQLTLSILSYDTIDNDTIPIEVDQIESGQPMDWSSQESALQPTDVTTAAWNAIWSNLVAMVGTTTDSFTAALAQAATYLGNLGETTAQVSDVGLLWPFLVEQADAVFPTSILTSAIDASLATPGNLSLAIDRTFVSTIAGRYQPGMFGLGWATSWQTSLSTDAAGNVIIDSGRSFAYFVKQPNGDYLNIDTEYGTLTQSGGVYTFTDSSGTQYVFLPDGQLNNEQDTNGNRITLGYDAQNQLVSLTYSNVSDPSEPTQQLTLTYNAQEFVKQVTDGTGDTWSYAYDSAGHLLSVTAPGNLTTSYTYDTGSDPERANTLLSITNPDGSQQDFADDAQGRLSGTSQNGGADPITFAYGNGAEVILTDARGAQATIWFNDLGLPARVEDPIGGFSSLHFDPNGNLTSFTDAAGGTYQYSYDTNGNLTQIVNPLGQTVRMTYNPLITAQSETVGTNQGPVNDMTSMTDAAGNTTQYQYDTAGNLLSITYPDGTQQSFSYNPLGNMNETIEQNGDPVSYQYNAQGLVTQESFSDKTSEALTYDPQGNLLTAKTFDAKGTLTGTTALTYNTDAQGQDIGGELASITYPNGQYLKFTYNSRTGQRTQSVDQSGFIVNYQYDALGRLSELTDGSGKLIVKYAYNNLGELETKLDGNGTSTAYAYDAAGDLTSEVNDAPDGKTVNSSFTYTYNVLGEVTTMTDAAGNTTSYGYDATGQLTQVNLPGGQTITYVYNAAGDRTEVIDGGTTTSYRGNSDNEITRVGSTTYTYDANGNLHAVTDSSGTTTYDYNDLNQLISITAPDGTVTTFQYSPLGFLVGENVGGAQTNYLVDPTGIGSVVGSYNGSGSLIARYVYGLGLVSQTGPSGTGYYDFDGGGNTVGITGSNGVYVNQYSYLPFGETAIVSAALPNPFTFVGQLGVTQIGTDLFSMRARVYTPATGQFLSNDPLGLAGGDSNLRRYVSNDPTNFVDPQGLLSWGDIGGILLSILNLNLSGNVHGDVQIPIGGSTTNTSIWKRSNGSSGFGRNQTTHPIGHVNFGWNLNFGSTLTGPGKMRPGKTQKTKLGQPKAAKNTKIKTKTKGRKDEDPNALIGPAGYGTPGFIQPIGLWPYTVDFANDGSVAAQDVTVTQQLDPNLGWSTFQLGSFGFGPIEATVPAGLTRYQTTVPYRNVDGTSLNVDVALNFNVQTGLLTATFTSLDPITGQAPTGVTDGFLPPDNSSGIGEGFVQYTIQPKTGLATGTAINQQASVIFDINAPIATQTVTNTIDAGAPTSAVAPLPATSGTSFTVSWSGSDGAGPGIAGYDVYVSDDSGPYTIWQSATTATSATFTGQAGHRYAFYSVATDPLGFVQPTPTAPQATTTVNNSTTTIPTPTPTPPPPVIIGEQALFTRKLNKKLKPVGKPALTGFVLHFSTAMDPATAGNAANYQVDWVSSRRAKHKRVQVLHPVPITATYDAVDRAVSLLLGGKQAFAQGGQIAVLSAPPNGVSGASGVLLDGNDEGRPGDNGTFTILPRARGITRASSS